MLPPHLPANRKIANGAPTRAGSASRKHPAIRLEPRRIVLRGQLRIQVEKPQPMIVRARKEKARLC